MSWTKILEHLRMKNFAFLVAILACQIGWCTDAVTAKVVFAGTYGEGRLFVTLDTLINEPGCEKNRFDVAAGHDQIDHWLSIALAAALSGADVKVQTNGCHAGFPTMNSSTNTYFFILSP